MEALQALFPTPEDLLAASTEDLAPILLKLARSRLQPGGMFLPDAVAEIQYGFTGQSSEYSHYRRYAVEAALSETWNWLRTNSLIAPAPDLNGRNGWMIITRSGQEITDELDFERFRVAKAFPKSLLHPSIADKVWPKLARGDLAEAVLFAFRAVEEAVREAGGFSAKDIGVALVRSAFDKTTGPLTDFSQPEAEREALAHLFAGAIGSYKNSHSHRTVNLTDPREAQEQTLLATHLLRIIDARRPA